MGYGTDTFGFMFSKQQCTADIHFRWVEQDKCTFYPGKSVGLFQKKKKRTMFHEPFSDEKCDSALAIQR